MRRLELSAKSKKVESAAYGILRASIGSVIGKMTNRLTALTYMALGGLYLTTCMYTDRSRCMLLRGVCQTYEAQPTLYCLTKDFEDKEAASSTPCELEARAISFRVGANRDGMTKKPLACSTDFEIG